MQPSCLTFCPCLTSQAKAPLREGGHISAVPCASCLNRSGIARLPKWFINYCNHYYYYYCHTENVKEAERPYIDTIQFLKYPTPRVSHSVQPPLARAALRSPNSAQLKCPASDTEAAPGREKGGGKINKSQPRARTQRVLSRTVCVLPAESFQETGG